MYATHLTYMSDKHVSHAVEANEMIGRGIICVGRARQKSILLQWHLRSAQRSKFQIVRRAWISPTTEMLISYPVFWIRRRALFSQAVRPYVGIFRCTQHILSYLEQVENPFVLVGCRKSEGPTMYLDNFQGRRIDLWYDMMLPSYRTWLILEVRCGCIWM